MSQPPDGPAAPFDLGDIFKMVQDLQDRMQGAQTQFSGLTATAASGGGLVTANVNGLHRVLSLRFDPEVVSAEELEVLQDLTVAAVNMAMEKVDLQIREHVREMAGGVQLPFPIPKMG